ncbi:MAG: hypothetical protein WCR55_04960 [Lentisphaerota bacterium]
MTNYTDYFVEGVLLLIVLYLFYKTRADYRNLTSNTPKKCCGSIRSFLLKGVIFTFFPFVMASSAFKSLGSIIIFSLIMLLGIWNLAHAYMLTKYNQKKLNNLNNSKIKTS